MGAISLQDVLGLTAQLQKSIDPAVVKIADDISLRAQQAAPKDEKPDEVALAGLYREAAKYLTRLSAHNRSNPLPVSQIYQPDAKAAAVSLLGQRFDGAVAVVDKADLPTTDRGALSQRVFTPVLRDATQAYRNGRLPA